MPSIKTKAKKFCWGGKSGGRQRGMDDAYALLGFLNTGFCLWAIIARDFIVEDVEFLVAKYGEVIARIWDGPLVYLQARLGCSDFDLLNFLYRARVDPPMEDIWKDRRCIKSDS